MQSSMNKSIILMPVQNSLNLFWNFGSLLGLILIMQMTSGLLLAMRYMPDVMMAFESLNNIMNESWKGYMLRNLHANTASFFFLITYMHIGRGLYFKSYMMKKTWMIGVLILLILMGTAFLGYVLPWGQMSFWGSTVITNLISSIPYIGEYLVKWIWGGYSVSSPTLTRFFCLHYILPFVILKLVLIHLYFLHNTGSSNPMGINSSNMMIPFHPYYTVKDFMGFFLMLMLLMYILFFLPYFMMDNDNFIEANSMITPEHIQPEWYFLFAYAILRSIPSKLGGVIALFLSISILFLLPFINLSKCSNSKYYWFSKLLFWSLIMSILMLTWIGMKPVEEPYIMCGQMLSIIYFSLYFMIPLIEWFHDMYS